VAEHSDADGLYALPPEDFIAARTALVKQFKANGESAEAQRVAKLRRPTESAWALNRVAGTVPTLVTDLLRAGATLRTAMNSAMSGEASDLRAAEAEERAAVEAILSHAGGEGRSLTEIHRRRMAATLRAAVLDDDVARSLRNGTLDSDHEAPAFGFGLGPPPDESIHERSGKRPRADHPAHARDRDIKRAQSLESDQAIKRDLERLQLEADRLAQRARRLDTDAGDAERRASDLRARAAEAAAAAARASTKLASARAEAEAQTKAAAAHNRRRT